MVEADGLGQDITLLSHISASAGSVIRNFPRERVKISTKWGVTSVDGQLMPDTSREACRAACFGSMKRLGLDYIDLFIFRGLRRSPEMQIKDTARYMKVRLDVKFLPLVFLHSDTPRDQPY